MVTVDTWKRHFMKMAHKSFPNEDMYIVNQSGRGIGRNSYNRTTYKIRGSGSKDTHPSTIEIVSPVAQEVERAKLLIGNNKKNIKKKVCKKNGSSKTGRCSGKIKKKLNRKGKKQKDKKKKKTKRKSKK